MTKEKNELDCNAVEIFSGTKQKMFSCGPGKMRNGPKVRKRRVRREWELEMRWRMPDMQPIVLPWKFSGVFSRRDDDGVTALLCLFISLSL